MVCGFQECEARIESLRRKKSCGQEESVISAQNCSPGNDNRPATSPQNNAFPADEHIDLFADYKEKVTTAKPMDEEKRLEQEKYEKQIGYLTYLGQDTHEANRTCNWYDVAPKRNEDAFDEDGRRVEVGLKAKHRHDPMRLFAPFAERDDRPRVKSTNKPAKEPTAAEPPTIAKSRAKYSPIMLGIKRKSNELEDAEVRKHKRKRKDKSQPKADRKEKKKKKKHKKEKETESEVQLKKALERQKVDNIALLREKRLRREAEERLRTYELLHGKAPSAPVLVPLAPTPATRDAEPIPYVKQKYNSQFNPFLAKQNFN